MIVDAKNIGGVGIYGWTARFFCKDEMKMR